MILNFLLDPNVAYVVLALAFVITILAMLAPGTGVLEIMALAALVAAGFGIANNPVNTWAFIPILAGTVLIFITMRRTSRWYYLAAAIAILVTGTAFLYKGVSGIFAADTLLVLMVSASMGGFIWIIGHYTRKAFNQKITRDLSQLIGMTGRATTHIHMSGSAHVNSEEWSAISDIPIPVGSAITVIERNGLVLKVEKLND